ncbi:hypothetical protein NDU88_002143 [Pleurodeles waltl]|uniref:Reverse transcriptase domain-containing protein n=1 Tax=Pleurodeles waltl TaxID=8319 RepID=A0AAV7T1G1_PLEWA|nr:hypothetical protein NDU88_002143 [Pleurodeles waltl]
MNPLEAVKKELSEHFHEESRRIIFRSKVENLEKGEKCNSFFFKKIHSAHTPLVQLRNREGILCDTKEDIRKAVTDFYGDLYSEKRSDGDQAERFLAELLAEYIRKNPNIRGIQTPGDAKKEVKCSLYMDDVTLFCTDGKSVQSLPEACKDFGKASGEKINVDKSQAKLFGRWDLCNEPLPFPVEAGLVKILGIWFGGPGAAAKSWNERLAKVKQKLGFWSLRHLSIEGKALVLRNDALPVLQYVTQAWPLLANVERAVNSMVFHFVWHSKMDRVKRTVMHKEHRKGGKAVPDIPTILRAFFVCGCVRITLTNENKDHSAYKVFRFFLLPVWRRLGWDEWENATMFNWDLPWYYKKIEKFVVEFGLNCVTPSLWKPRTIHRLIRSRDTTEPVSDLPPATATRVWENVSSPSLTNRHKDIAWMAVKGGLPVRSSCTAGACAHTENAQGDALQRKLHTICSGPALLPRDCGEP